MTLSLGLFGCAQGFDVPTATTGNDGSSRGISPQSVKFDEELLGSERQAALQQALGDWKVQGVESLLESEGKQLERDKAQAFSFERGSHQGTLVLLSFGNRLLTWMEFRENSRLMLSEHLPGSHFRAVNDQQGRNEMLSELQVQESLGYLQEKLKKRDRHWVPGLTLLLKSDSPKEVLFIVFTKPGQAHESTVFGQLFFLDPGVDGDAGGSCIISCETSSSTSLLDPGTGSGGTSTFSISGISTAFSSSSFNAINFYSWHATDSNKATAFVTVDGELDPINYQPSGSFNTDCSAGGSGSVSCGTGGFQISLPQSGQSYGACASGFHTGEYQSQFRPKSSGPSCKYVSWR